LRTPTISRPIGMGTRSNWILLYTDGLTEAQNAVGSSFGDLSLECYAATRLSTNRRGRVVGRVLDRGPKSSTSTPPVDIYEDEHNIILKIEVPGIDEKDIDVSVQNNTLTVHGERRIEKEEKEENFRRVERQYGSFTRSFTVPSTVVNRAKKAEAKPTQIKVIVDGEKTLEAIVSGKAA
jgi:HSP20 family protein